MIRGIAREFARLPSVMVKPTADATEETEGLFSNLLSNLTEKLPPGMQGLFDDLTGRAVKFLADFSGKWGTAFTSMFGDGSGGLSGIVRTGLTNLGNLLFPGFGSLLASLEPIITAGLKKLGGLFSDFFKWVWDGFKSVLGFLSGGGPPTPGESDAGVPHDPLPLPSGGGNKQVPKAPLGGWVPLPKSGGGAPTFNVTINVDGNVLGTQDALARAVGDALVSNYKGFGNAMPFGA
jgi:hypothetical protein